MVLSKARLERILATNLPTASLALVVSEGLEAQKAVYRDTFVVLYGRQETYTIKFN